MLKLYPRAWRERYGEEIAEVVASQPGSLQMAIDLLGGAIDAHVKPQAFARRLERSASTDEGGPDMVNRLMGCCRYNGMTTRQALGSAGLTLLGGVAFAGYLMTDPGQFAEAVSLTMFPAFLLTPTQWMMTRGHSRIARCMLICGPFAICGAIGVVAGLVVTA